MLSFFIDKPESICRGIAGHSLRIVGWCFFENEAAYFVETRLDQIILSFNPVDQTRLDVEEAYPQIKKYGTPSGFDFTVKIPEGTKPGTFSLKLFALGRSGRRELCATLTLEIVGQNYTNYSQQLQTTPANLTDKVNRLNSQEAYNRLVDSLKSDTPEDLERAMGRSVGSNFDAVGILERELLIHFCGLQKDHYLIDIGCGSGRLAKPLEAYLNGKYLGTDVVPDLVAYARTLVPRNDWHFEVTNGLVIPEKDEQADLICFFSVFTHLLHEQSYVYLEEAKRVIKPNGKIVFSFLEFTNNQHWAIFWGNVQNIGSDFPLNMFMSRDAIQAWAEHLDLKIDFFQNGDAAFIPLPHRLEFPDTGQVMEGMGYLGQSVCVMSKK